MNTSSTLPFKFCSKKNTTQVISYTYRKALVSTLTNVPFDADAEEFWSNTHTIYSALWLEFPADRASSLDLECIAVNSEGNASQYIGLIQPRQPQQPKMSSIMSVTSTSVLVAWLSGFHGSILPSFKDSPSPFTNNSIEWNLELKKFYQQWRAQSRLAQSFQIELSDFGSVAREANENSEILSTTVLDTGHATIVNITGLVPGHRYGYRIRGAREHIIGAFSEMKNFKTSTNSFLSLPHIEFDESGRRIRIAPGDPGLCVQLMSSRDNGNTWQLERLPFNQRSLRVNGKEKGAVQTNNLPELLNCVPLSWSSSTLVANPNAAIKQLRICTVGNTLNCTKIDYPQTAFPPIALLVAGGFCALLILMLSIIFVRLVWMRSGECHGSRQRTIHNSTTLNDRLNFPEYIEDHFPSLNVFERISVGSMQLECKENDHFISTYMNAQTQ